MGVACCIRIVKKQVNIESLLALEIRGTLQRLDGSPIANVPLTVKTSRSEHVLQTDLSGRYKCKLQVTGGEGLLFTFVNKIGDRVRFWREMPATDHQVIDFTMDYRGAVFPTEKNNKLHESI